MRAVLQHWIGLLLLGAVIAGCGEDTSRVASAPMATITVSTVPTAKATQLVFAPPSPLVPLEFVTYRGETSYTGKPPIEVVYDPATWRFVADREAPALTHAGIDGCTLVLRHGSGEAIYIGEIDLGVWHWAVYNNGPQFPDELIYATLLTDYAAGFRVNLPPGATDVERTACRNAAEAVLATFASTEMALTPHPPGAHATAMPFAANDTSSWPTFDAGSFNILYPPGWMLQHAEASVDSSYWQFAGLLPASRADHFRIHGGVTVVKYVNPERLSLVEWVAHLPADEREMTLQTPRELTLGAQQPAIAVTAYVPWANQTYIRTWTACDDEIWQISMLSGFRPALQIEMEAIYTHMTASFHCTPAP